ncbi:restriction endonuclease subunit S [Telluria antibiotica]|uniref:restriction endonuclease subunit S n=1 Tax=Telluria antibiotica TaxID=2717319 RepID=UPI001AAE5EE1|nr:restriction endonuclease subunit S [Telluria antibiotica]
MKLHRYPEYKDSGLPWVGEIPAHWETMRARYLFREVDRRSVKGEETHLSMSQVHGLVPSKGLNRKSLQSESYAGGKLVAEDDLVLNRLKAHLGVFARASQSGVVSPDYSVFQPSGGASVGYCERLFKTPLYVAEFRRRTKGIVEGFWRLYTDDFYSVRALLPPKVEQDKIITYLRAQDAHIARFIKVKHSALSLLAEARAVLADQAIRSDRTQQIRLDRVLRLVSKPIQRMPNEAYTAIGLKNRGRGIFHKPSSLGRDLGDSIFFPVEEGDFVFSGQFAWEGAVAVAAEADHGCIASHRYPIAKCDRDLVLPEYLYTFFLSGKGDLILNHHSRGAAGRNRPLNPRTLLKEAIPVPPIDLQYEVLALYKEELKVKRDVEKELALIREFRDRQIVDVVTGQVDVRSWQPGHEDQITEEDLTALGDVDDDTTEEETDGDDGHE